MSDVVISTDNSLLNLDFIHGFLSTSYWAKGISKELVQKSIDNSVCFGMYRDGRQIGFARVITDFSVFAYLADVFIAEDVQGNGYGTYLVKNIMEAKELQGLRRWHLLTGTAQGLYRKFGFDNPEQPENHMEKRVSPEELYGG